VARGVVIAVFALFLFFCHVIVLGVATLTALGYVLGTHYRSGRELAIRLLPLVAPMPLIVAWLLATFDREASVHTDPIVFGPLVYRLEALLIQPSGRDSFSTLVTPLVTGSILVLPWLSGARFSRRPERWLPFAMALAAFLLLPHFVLSTAYVYQRLGVFLVPVWFLAWERTERQWRFDWVPMLVVTVWGLANAGRFAAFARETQTFETVIAAMEPGRTAGAMVVDHSSPFFALPVYMHFPSWYQAQRGGVVDFNFADFHPQMVRYRKEVGSRIGETLAWYPTAFQWSEHDGARYDYFLVKAPWDVSQEIFKDKRGAVRLIAHDGWWWLYSNEERERSR